MIENGDIAQDAGYDQSRGIIADRNSLESITVCDPCIDYLTSAGLFNLKITNRKRWLGAGGFYTFEESKNTEDAGVINQEDPQI